MRLTKEDHEDLRERSKPKSEASLAAPQGSALADALALVDIGPLKTVEWMERATPMCKHCRPNEDVDQAAARILAVEVRRLRAAIETTMPNEKLTQDARP